MIVKRYVDISCGDKRHVVPLYVPRYYGYRGSPTLMSN